MKLKKIIEDKYYNSEEIIKLLETYELENLISQSVNTVDEKIENKDFNSLINISGIILTGVNSFMQKINNPSDKIKIEYFLGDLFQSYFSIILNQGNGNELLSEIQKSLKIACEIGDFDYDQLTKYLDLEKNKILIPKVSLNPLCYTWNKEEYELSELAKDLSDKQIIYSVKEFKKLFKPIKGHLSIRCNPEKREQIIVLFQIMKDFELITPKGTSGHFAPIVKYCVDNEGIFLFKKAANKIHYNIKRNNAKYLKMKKIAKDLIMANVKL